MTGVGDKGKLRVEIIDTGRGISPADLPHIFDRFYRAERARSTASGNVGLGLSIVKSIVSLHGGSIDVSSEENQGTRMSILIPGNSQ